MVCHHHLDLKSIKIYLVLCYQYNPYMCNDLVYPHTIHEKNSIYKDHIELVNHLAVDGLVRTSNHFATFLSLKKKSPRYIATI